MLVGCSLIPSGYVLGYLVNAYLVKTDYGDVLVEVNPACDNALEKDLLLLHKPTPDNTRDINMEVPLRAFSAKMVDIIEGVGTGGVAASPKLLEMMKEEKATDDLTRIERWAKENA